MVLQTVAVQSYYANYSVLWFSQVIDIKSSTKSIIQMLLNKPPNEDSILFKNKNLNALF